MSKITKLLMFISLTLTSLFITSCIDPMEPLDPKDKDENPYSYNYPPLYVYPYGNEARNITAEITITTDGTVDLNNIEAEIPHLKFNKSWLFMLTQDDCLHSAFSCTWAAINGKPLTNTYFYDIRHLFENDLPPDIYYLNKTLGSDDGTGKEVRFHFTTTVFPQANPTPGYLGMYDAKSGINPGFTENYYRFFMKSFLIWDNVIEMLNYGNSIAFHDVRLEGEDLNNTNLISDHFMICQDSIKKNLSQRGCKVLAEPNGNINYYYSALNYDPIKIITGQGNAPYIINPYTVNSDLEKEFIRRHFSLSSNAIEQYKNIIINQLSKPLNQREAVHVGEHRTDKSWVDFLVWINDTYGKDGDNSVWMPSLEEYYEYNYYRIHSTITKTIIDNNTVKFTVQLPSQEYFYYPSITLNLQGINNQKIQSITSNDAIKGLSYGNNDQGLMVNIDCRKFLIEHATHYVEQYEMKKTSSNKTDALYFTNQLKDSPQKTSLLNRINP